VSAMVSARAITGARKGGGALRRSKGCRSITGVPARAQQQQRVLVGSTTSGNHASIGLHTAQQLAARGHRVVLALAGELPEDEAAMGPPVMYFESHLRQQSGVSVVWAGSEFDALSDVLHEGTFNVIVDNNSKDSSSASPLLQLAKERRCARYVFVSSCGIYKEATAVPLLEDDPIKPDTGQAEVEHLLHNDPDIGSFVSLRPQYPTGFGHVTRGDTFFFDRIFHNRTIPIPGTGEQVVNLCDASDLGNMAALAAENGNAHNRAFNCVGERGVTLNGIAKLCAHAAGSEPNIVHYDPDKAGVDPKKAFPFRSGAHFFAEPRNAVELLGWRQQHSLQSTLQNRWAEYKQIRDQSEVDFSMDDQIFTVAK